MSDPDLVLITGREVTLGIGVTLAEVRRHAPRGARAELSALVRELARRRTVTVAPFWIERVPKLRGKDYGSSFAAIEAGVAQQGYRLPTPDEWELAYGAGARTLFPWGNQWYRPPGWQHPHGIASLAQHTDSECTSVYRVFVGGDSGCLSCGGSRFAAITSASSYVADRRAEWDDVYDEHIWYGGSAVRRVRSA